MDGRRWAALAALASALLACRPSGEKAAPSSTGSATAPAVASAPRPPPRSIAAASAAVDGDASSHRPAADAADQAPSLLDVDVESTTETYMISGNTAAELRAKLNAKGPTDEAGRHDALTHWFVKWKYPFDRQAGTCGTGPVRAELTLRFEMPQWAHGDAAPSELVEKWDGYVERLLEHEDGHADNGRAAARAIVQALRAMPAMASCDEMDAAANARAEEILADYRKRDVDYDARTKHGATQGAVFP